MRPRVLIVDDHPAFPEAAEALLDAEGLAVTLADPREALTAADQVDPDVVLVDADLLDGDACELASGLARRHAVVLLSARERSEYIPLLRRCGARAVLDKASLCADALRDVLGGRAAAA